MRDYIYAPEANQLDGIMQPINPLMGANSDAGMTAEGWQPMYQSWALQGAGEDAGAGPEGWQPMYQSWALNGEAETGQEGWGGMYQSWALSGIDDSAYPFIRNDMATPTVDIRDASTQFGAEALNGGLGAVQDALQVLSVVDLLTKGA